MQKYPSAFLYGSRTVAAACCGALLLAGCGDSGLAKFHVSGQVTWRGEPVPAGIVTFSPDVRQGNTGPQGYAEIRDGRYSTRDGDGRATVGGPHMVAVAGFDGQNPTEDSPQGRRLFPEYQMEYDLPSGSTTLDIDIPERLPGHGLTGQTSALRRASMISRSRLGGSRL